MLRKLGAYRQQNRLYLALGEIGRIERTLFMLEWMESPQLRMECQAGLNKGEARHALARAVFAHSQGRIHDRSHDAQQRRVMALNPRHRRHRLLEHVIHREGRQPSAPRATVAEPELASARLAVGMGAHRVDRRLRLELRGCGAHQRPSVEPLSHETPRLALDAESDP